MPSANVAGSSARSGITRTTARSERLRGNVSLIHLSTREAQKADKPPEYVQDASPGSGCQGCFGPVAGIQCGSAPRCPLAICH
jgi:hypothetical protein